LNLYTVWSQLPSARDACALQQGRHLKLGEWPARHAIQARFAAAGRRTFMAGISERGARCGCRYTAALVACLVLSVCAGPPAQGRWVKAGVDDATTAREIDSCHVQASSARGNEQGINQDISATLGRNWQMSDVTRIEDQTMRQQAADIADQVFSNCMRAKGFAKSG
jgi:hypothetical protein